MSNVQVIPAQTGGAKKPENLLNAISEIQQYYVFESQGDDLPPDFFTLEMFMSFMKLGVISALYEGIILLFIGIGEYFLLPMIFVFFRPANFSLFLKYLPFAGMLINTLLCLYISRYYMGKLTRRIISSLLYGRCIGLTLISLLTYVFFIFLDGLATKQRMFSLLNWFGILFKNAPYYFHTFFSMKPFPLGRLSLLIIISGFTPFIFVFIISFFRKLFLKRKEEKVSTHRGE